MPLASQKQLRTAEVTMLAADASKEIVAAPGAGKKIVVHSIQGSILVSAAQACDIEDTSGTEELIRFAASPTAHMQFARKWDNGYPLTTNEALLIKPAAAGPSVHVTVEYWIDGI